MDDLEAVPTGTQNAVDPELKAHITSLVSALGGPDQADVDRKYLLGDEALACLRDIKKWITGYDERMNRWDIARAVSETSLVTSDLLEILTAWESDCQNKIHSKMNERIALACLELLVPLTWPLDLNKTTSTNNHYRHAPYLIQARLRYKKAILTHPKQLLLRAVLRLSLPVLTKPRTDRTTRDDGIMNLVLYFFRNILAIEPGHTEGQRVEQDISRSSTLSVFKEQNVIDFLIMVSSQVGTLFNIQDTVVMECLFYVFRGIKPKFLFPTADKADDDHNDQENQQPTTLSNILSQEKQLKRSSSSSSRHSRFGTMVSMVNEQGDRYTVSGADGLLSKSKSLQKLDANKAWSRPGRRQQDNGESWNQPVPLSQESATIAGDFARGILFDGFNNVISSVRRLVETDNDRITSQNQLQLLYLAGFFLQCERRRRNTQRKVDESKEDYGLVAEVLNQNMFIVVMKLMRECSEKGPGQNLPIVYASLLCFSEILLVVQQMDQSISEYDQEVAHNMKQRLFYEEHSLQVLAMMPRIAARQSQEFLTKTVELTLIVLKMLDRFTKQHTVLYVRSKRQRRTKKKEAHESDDEMGYLNDLDPEEESRRVTTERKFEFGRFERKYVNVDTIDAYKRYLSSYREMTSSEIMAGLWFVHRVFSYKESRAYFYSLDFMRLLQRLTDSHDGIPKTYKARREVDRFMAYYMRKLTEALDRTPSLYVELLFTKMPEHLYYLDYGYDLVKESSKKGPKLAQDWEFKDGEFTEEQQHGILIAVLIDEEKLHLIEWITDQMTILSADREGKGSEADDYKLSGTEDQILATKQDGKFRFLLKILGFSLPETMYGECTMNRVVELEKIQTGLKYLKKYQFEPFKIEDQPDSLAGDFLQRDKPAGKTRATRRLADEDDSDSPSEPASGDENSDPADGLPDDIDEQIGLKKRKRKSGITKKPNSRRKLHRDGASPRRGASTAPPPTKRYKSADFIDSEDDLTDEERDEAFFRSEEQLRRDLLAKMKVKLVVADSRDATNPTSSYADSMPQSPLKWDRPTNDDDTIPSSPVPDAVVSPEESPASPVESDNEPEIPSSKRAKRIIIDDEDDE